MQLTELAQLEERSTFNRVVVGSSPIFGETCIDRNPMFLWLLCLCFYGCYAQQKETQYTFFVLSYHRYPLDSSWRKRCTYD